MEPPVLGEHLAIGSVSSPIHTTFMCPRQCMCKYHDLCKNCQGHIIANISASRLYYCQGFPCSQMKVQLNTHLIWSFQFVLEVDALHVGVGAILS